MPLRRRVRELFEKNALLYLTTEDVKEIKQDVDNAIAQAVMVDDFEFEEDFDVDLIHGEIPQRKSKRRAYRLRKIE